MNETPYNSFIFCRYRSCELLFRADTWVFFSFFKKPNDIHNLAGGVPECQGVPNQALRKNLLVPSLFGVTLQLHAGILTRALRLKAASAPRSVCSSRRSKRSLLRARDPAFCWRSIINCAYLDFLSERTISELPASLSSLAREEKKRIKARGAIFCEASKKKSDFRVEKEQEDNTSAVSVPLLGRSVDR